MASVHYRLTCALFFLKPEVVTERGTAQALVNQKVRSLGRFGDAQQLAVLAGMLADWSLVLQGRSAQVCLGCVRLKSKVRKLTYNSRTHDA